MNAMRSGVRLGMSLVVTTALVTGASFVPAGASVATRLADAQARRDAARRTVSALRAQFPELEARLAVLQREAGTATIGVIDALRAEQSAADALAEAQRTFDDRARAAFEFGPAATIEAMLAARSLAELSTVNEYAGRTLAADSTSLESIQAAQEGLSRARSRAEAEQRTVGRRESALAAEVSALQGQLDAALGQAHEAGLSIRDLAREQAQLRKVHANQRAREAALAAARLGASGSGGLGGISVDSSWFDGRNQDDLLALLGPTGGRTCTIPPGLKDTGEGISGDATWYGWDFAGQSTASGATFDPRLMTAAHRTLPFGSFLRVRYQQRCVIVLVNDRGPYGNYDRVIDLSLGAARALGTESIGVAPVTADVLVPR
jgi:peptidoglycan hydrolase CwlO-like protein